ncbi:hypothetical protein YC2023_112203 [Brassica napus]
MQSTIDRVRSGELLRKAKRMLKTTLHVEDGRVSALWRRSFQVASQERTEKEAKGKSILTEHKKKEREAAKNGQKALLSQTICILTSCAAEIRKQELNKEYNSLKLSLFLDKRRKKNATKDHRYMPYRRADTSEQ